MFFSSSTRRNHSSCSCSSEQMARSSSSLSDATDVGDYLKDLEEEEADNDESVSFLDRLEELRPINRQKDRIFLSAKQWLRACWHQHLVPDGPWKIGKQVVMDKTGVKLLKFCGGALSSILLIHYYAIFVDADRDDSYGLREMVLFDGNNIVFDLVVFFVVGRLYEDSSPSVDTLGWILPSIGTAILQSYLASNSDSLHHSITAHDMHCSWSWQFWVLMLCGALPAIVLLVAAHLYHAATQHAVLQKILELGLAATIFFIPYASSSFFHLHHWYYALVLGMHANAHDRWWSRLTQCICFGIYINGIAIYGRDPIMTCAVTYYQSHNQECPYLPHDSNQSWDAVLRTTSQSLSLDWRNCDVEKMS